MEQPIRGRVERVVFSNEETGFAVLRFLAEDEAGALRREVAVVGVIPGVRAGLELRMEGTWEESSRFGRQFRIRSFRVIPPSTREGVEKYLASGVIPGIGKVMANRLVEAFGKAALDVIEKSPERLREVPGVGARRAKDIRKAWEKQRGIQEVMLFLASHGVSPALSARIYREYGAEAIQVVQENPYRLADEVFGVGFLTADRIAMEVGIAVDAPARLEAGILYALGTAVSEGHLYLPQELLLESCVGVLGVDLHQVEERLEPLSSRQRVVMEELPGGGTVVYSWRLYQAEVSLASDLRALEGSETGPAGSEIQGWVSQVEKELDIAMAPEQRDAVFSCLTQRLSVITGGPGTGKTTLVRAIHRGFLMQGLRVALCAPTGRAARRLGEATGVGARTVHRLLEFSPRAQAFERNRDNPLATDVVIVDEASMLDVNLADALVQAIPPGARMVFVGDVDQLPPVGPGNVLRDIIESRPGVVIRLSRVFRQGGESRIVTNAHRINQGELPESGKPGEGADFFFIPREDTEHVLQTLKKVVLERVPKAFQFSPINDVQILTPMIRGDLGTNALNQALQGWLNPEGVSLLRGERVFRCGDRVMQIRNNYDKDVFNGDMGRIIAVDVPAREMRVLFDDREVTYESAELDELQLAYAVTVHKSQGSEYPVVVLPLHGQHFLMLRRNLVYTAITRGKKLVVVIGSPRALKMAVERDDMNRRYSRLMDRLREGT